MNIILLPRRAREPVLLVELRRHPNADVSQVSILRHPRPVVVVEVTAIGRAGLLAAVLYELLRVWNIRRVEGIRLAVAITVAERVDGVVGDIRADLYVRRGVFVVGIAIKHVVAFRSK